MLSTLKASLEDHGNLILHISRRIISNNDNKIRQHVNAAAALAQIVREGKRKIASMKQEIQAIKAAKFVKLIGS